MAEEKSQRFCPNCGSTWVEPDTSNRAEVYLSGGNPNKWQCNECGYTGLMPEGDPEDFREMKEDGKNIEFNPGEEYSREDIEFGTGYLKFILYIMVPVVGFYVVYLTLLN